MKFWASLIGYQIVWFAAVIGGAHDLAWPGVLGMIIYAGLQLAMARNCRVDLTLMAAAVLCGLLIDGGLIRTSLASYAAGWPGFAIAPAWILALWMTFALTFSQSLAWLQTRLPVAALLGLLGGPLAYIGAARGWNVVSFAHPSWHALVCLGSGWAVATPTLAWLARPRSATPFVVSAHALTGDAR